jgi:hypothetical protein
MSNALVLRRLFALAQGKPAAQAQSKATRSTPQQGNVQMSTEPTVMPRKLRLPRDASIQYNEYPPQLYLN